MTLEELVVVITAETSKLEKGLKKTTSSLNSVQKVAKKMSSSVSNSFKTLNKNVNNTFKSITKAVSFAAVIAGLFKLGKTALDTASDIEEVQNVVNVAFGAAAAEINKFSKSAIKSFGLSELSAKRYASTFMAMSNGMGVATDSGKTMSIELTKLVGDMASFYNVSQDVASTALASIYTGETETLKKFGVVMTEANLKAFALSRGITKQYSAMSQAEKVALRYNYVMAQTAQAQGDFARTSGNWANQIRILKEQYAAFMGVLGTALKQVLLPVLQTLNNILSTLITTAQTVFSMMGIKFEIEGSSVSNTVEGVGDIETGFEGATQAAKAFDKTISGFDELNVLNSKASGTGGGSGSSVGGGIEIDKGGASTEIEQEEGLVLGGLNKMLSNLNNWFDTKMGPWLSDKAVWLAEKVNDMADKAPWGLIGETAANGLNNVVVALDKFFSTIDGFSIGAGLSKLLNSFVAEFDAEAFGKMIGEKIKTGLDIAIGFVATLDATALGTAFADMLNGLDTEAIAEKLGTLLSESVKRALEFLNAFISGADSEQLKESFNAFFSSIDGTGIKALVEDLVGNINTLIESLTGVEKALNKLLWTLGIITALGFAGKILAASGAIGHFITALVGGRGAAGAFSDSLIWLGQVGEQALADKLGITVKTLNGLTSKLGGVKAAVLGIGTTFTTAANTVLSQSGIILQSGSKLQVLTTYLSAGLKGLWAVIKAHPIAMIITAIVSCAAAVANLYKKSENFRNFVNDLWDNTLKPVINNIIDSFRDLWNKHLKPLWNDCIQPMLKSFGDTFRGLWDTISAVVGWIVGILGGVFLSTFTNVFASIINTTTTIIGGVIDVLRGLITFLTGVFSGDWKKAWSGIQIAFQGVITAMASFIKGKTNAIIGFMNGLIKGIVSGVNAVIRAVNRLKLNIPEWVPVYGGKSIGFSLQTFSAPQIPYLADGGVAYNPTLAMIGEYSGASNNPEIVAPQSLLQQIISSGNDELIDVMVQLGRQVIGAIEDKELAVSIGDDAIANSAARGNRRYYKQTGRPLITVG